MVRPGYPFRDRDPNRREDMAGNRRDDMAGNRRDEMAGNRRDDPCPKVDRECFRHARRPPLRQTA